MIGRRFYLKGVDIEITGENGDTWEVVSICEPDLESLPKQTIFDAISLGDIIDFTQIFNELSEEHSELDEALITKAIQECMQGAINHANVKSCAKNKLGQEAPPAPPVNENPGDKNKRKRRP